MKKNADTEEHESGQREVQGEMESVPVVCRRACFESRSSLSEMFGSPREDYIVVGLSVARWQQQVREEAVQLVVCGVRRLACAVQCGSQRGVGVLGARPATGCVRKSRVCSQVVLEPADGWRHPRGHDLRRFAGTAG